MKSGREHRPGLERRDLHRRGSRGWDGSYFVSIITEIEVLGYPGISPSANDRFRELFRAMCVVGISDLIKECGIRLKQTSRLKSPDAIIAATALTLGIPLLTNDEAFGRVDGITLKRVELLPPRV